MSDTQTYCGHIFIIVVASGGTSGHRKLLMRSGVRAGRERERDQGREQRQIGLCICPKSGQKLLLRPVLLLKQNYFKTTGWFETKPKKTPRAVLFLINVQYLFL